MVRQKIVETGDVDVMISIRSNFFYTRTVPCELWHFDRDKPADRKDKVLMLDARNVYRKVTRKIYEVLLTWKIESQLTKDQILELYRSPRPLGAEDREGLLYDLAHAIVTNALIDAVNARWGATIPHLNVANYATATSSNSRSRT